MSAPLRILSSWFSLNDLNCVCVLPLCDALPPLTQGSGFLQQKTCWREAELSHIIKKKKNPTATMKPGSRWRCGYGSDPRHRGFEVLCNSPSPFSAIHWGGLMIGFFVFFQSGSKQRFTVWPSSSLSSLLVALLTQANTKYLCLYSRVGYTLATPFG